LLCRREQIVAPVDQCAHGLLARQRRAVAAGENPKPLVEFLRQRVDGDDPYAGGGEFDRERNAVETPADLRDDRRVRIGEREAVIDTLRALGKKGDRSERSGVGCTQPVAGLRRRSIQRGEPVRMLAGDAQRLATRRENAKLGAAAQECIGDIRGFGDDVFAIVENHERSLLSQKPRERLDERAVRQLLDAQRRRDCSDDKFGVGERCEFDEPQAVVRDVAQGRSYLQRRARLADPARPGQGDHPLPSHECHDLTEFGIATHEARQR
jgi:hypothetical protein